MSTIEDIANASKANLNCNYSIVYFYSPKKKWVKLLIRNKWLRSSIERTTELVGDIDSIELAHIMNVPLRKEVISEIRSKCEKGEENWNKKGIKEKLL